MKLKMDRRGLSGIYIFHKFEGEDGREPTCFEDCPEEKQDQWLNSLDPEAVKNLAKQLAKTLRAIGDQFDIATGEDSEDTPDEGF
jgi:hypothetical protein